MLPPERKAPRTKLALQQSFSSTPRLMCSASVSVASVPKARKTAWIFSGSVMVKLRFLVAEGAGSAADIGKRIHEELGLDPRVTVLGHIQRGGSPSARDRETASRMGYKAVMALVSGPGNCIIATQDGRIVDLDMEEALQMKKSFPMERYQILEALTLSGSHRR